MTEPSEKSPAMTQFLDSFTKRTFSRSRTDSITIGKCVTCGEPTEDFRDDLSRKEYTISGLCQVCQDGVFGA